MKLPQVSSHTLIKKFKSIGYQDAPFQGKGSRNHIALYKDADGTKLLVIILKCDPVLYYEDIFARPIVAFMPSP